MIETAHAIGVTTADIGADDRARRPGQDRRRQDRRDIDRDRPARSCGRKNTTNPMAATAAWFETTTEAASTTATMNVIEAATPMAANARTPMPTGP